MIMKLILSKVSVTNKVCRQSRLNFTKYKVSFYMNFSNIYDCEGNTMQYYCKTNNKTITNKNWVRRDKKVIGRFLPVKCKYQS